MIYKFFVKIGRDRNGMTAGKRNLVYLLYGFETCRKNLGLYVVVVEDLHDLFYNVNTVGYDVVETVDVRCNVINAGFCRDECLLLGEDRGHRDLYADLLEFHCRLESVGGDRDLDVEIAAYGLLKSLCLLNDVRCVIRCRLDVEHLVGTDYGADLADQLLEIGMLAGDYRGVGRNSVDGIELGALLYGVKLCRVNNKFHLKASF